jgi:hypothetical protein
VTVATCYQTPDDKRRIFPTLVIPTIYNLAALGVNDPTLHDWLQGAGVDRLTPGLGQLLALHELARAGLYRSPWAINCDPPQAVAVTITQGGDCDQWATVLLAATKLFGYRARLVTFGDRNDRFQHVAVAVAQGGKWYNLDPKGDPAGLDFNRIDGNYLVFESWEPTPDYDAA